MCESTSRPDGFAVRIQTKDGESRRPRWLLPPGRLCPSQDTLPRKGRGAGFSGRQVGLVKQGCLQGCSFEVESVLHGGLEGSLGSQPQHRCRPFL